MLSTNNKTSHLINSQVPGFVSRDHQTFVEFLEYYYKFMEQHGETMEVSKNLQHYMDIDNTVGNNATFQQKLYDNFIKVIPEATVADKTIILKHATDFYRSRGSEKSIRFLLRILFDKEADIYYPKQDILRASDGKWFIERSVRVNTVFVGNTVIEDAATKFKSHLIRGESSNATAIVEDVDVYFEKGAIVSELKLSGITKPFDAGEFVFTYVNEDGQDKLVRANIFSGIVINAAVVESGNGYFEGESIPVEPINGLGSGAQAIVLKTTKGGLKNILVEFSGAGFKKSDDVLITGGSGFGASANVFRTDESGTYHPNSYLFMANTIADVANLTIGGNAFANLVTLSINTSNLTVNTGAIGVNGNVSIINLSYWAGNSNVWFETGDQINVNNKTVTVTSMDPNSNVIMVNPPLGSNLENKTMVIYKKPNANVTLANSMYFWAFTNVGPVTSINIITPGQGYRTLPRLSIRGNTSIRSLGILGRMNVDFRGEGYQAGDRLEFLSNSFTYGSGAAGYVETVNATGAILNVKFDAVPGYPVGGLGYDRANLPNVKIVTTGGTNAVVRVTSLLGEGERLITVPDTIGSILEIRMQQGGSGYTEPPTLNLAYRADGSRRQENDIANAFTTIVTGIYTYPGKFINDDGHISSYNFLQNKNYYQNFSYVVRLSESINQYRKTIKDLTHPMGVKVFGEYLTFNDDATRTVPSSNVWSSIGYRSEVAEGFKLNLDAANNESYFANTPGYWYNLAESKTPEINTATLYGNTYIENGIVYFDGSGDYANVGNTVIDGLNEFSIGIWYNRARKNVNEKLVSEWYSANVGGSFYLGFTEDNFITFTDSWANTGVSCACNANSWIKISAISTTTNAHIYVNGVLKASKGSPITFDTTGAPFVIGRNGEMDDEYFHGKITEVMVYNYALSNTEVERNFAATKQRFGI